MPGFAIVDRERDNPSCVLMTVEDEDAAYAAAMLFWRRGIRAAVVREPQATRRRQRARRSREPAGGGAYRAA